MPEDSQDDFEHEEKRQIKRSIDEPVEHINMVNDDEEGEEYPALTQSSDEESEDIVIALDEHH